MDEDCKRKVLSNDYADLLSDFFLIPDRLPEFAEDDYCIIFITEVYQLIYVSRTRLQLSRGLISAYWNNPNIYGLMQEPFDPISLEVSGIIQTQRPPLSLTGAGVVIGFVDTGIDYTNPAFRDAEGNTRILAIWDQTIQTGTPPAGFVYGSEYTREDINRALQSENPYDIVPSQDTNGHGSNMAGVAAGSSLGGGYTYLGAAPDTDIVVVKLKECKPYLREFHMLPGDVPAYMESDIMLGVKYIHSFLRVFNAPVVICLGLGTNMGDHAGSSMLARYLNELSVQRNVGIVVSGGNEGNKEHHFMGLLQQQTVASDSNYQEVELRVGSGEVGFWMELWGSIPDIFNIQIRSPGGESIPKIRLGTGQSYNHRFVYDRTRITIVNLIAEEISGEQLILVRFEEPTEGIWVIRVYGEGTIHNGVFNIWLPISQFLHSRTTFLEASPYVTLTEPSYAQNVITVSSYNDVNNSFYIESGRGFARNGLIKPDLAAPGVNVSTIEGMQTGSSLSGSFTAGAVAQFMQWAVVEDHRYFVTNREIKNHFIRGADRQPNIVYPSREWGFGRLNIAQVFDVMAGV